MISDSVTSGELYFRLFLEDEKKAGENDIKLPSSMRTFLKRKDDPNKEILHTRHRALQLLLARLNFLKSTLPTVKGMSNAAKLRIFREKLLLKNALEAKGQEFDACALQSVLQYAAVLQQELADAQRSLVQERAMKEILREQARVSHELILFSTHLALETKSRIELQHLSPSTAQYVRCVKAVHDNLHNCFGFNKSSPMIPDPDNVQILNIFKLKNTVLARNLQKSTAKATGAKMKGLFCSMPIDQLYRFAVHGLREQALPAKIPDYGADPALKECFRTPWIFCNKEQPLAPIPSELRTTLHEAGFASRCLRAATASTRPVLRFSKYSTLSTMMSYSEPQLQQGLCLALCRVMIVRVKTINTFIEDLDISAAFQQGYDAIYSSLSEEYALLQPQYVLPEFFIHANFTSLQQQPQPQQSLSSQSPPKATLSTSPYRSHPSMMNASATTVLPSYLRVNLTDALQQAQSTSGNGGGPLAASLVTATTAWAHAQPAACPQHVLLTNHYQHLRQLVHPPAIQGPSSSSSSSGGVSYPHQDGRGVIVLHPSTSTPHRYITIKQGSLQAIETAVDDVRKTLIASKLAMAKRLLQWCSEEQKRAALIVLQQLQQQQPMTNASVNVSSSSSLDGLGGGGGGGGAGRKGKRKQFLADASSVSDSYEAQPKTGQELPTAVGRSSGGNATHKTSAKRTAAGAAAAVSRPSIQPTAAEIDEDEGVMLMVNEAMRATSLDSPRHRPQQMSEDALEDREYGNDGGSDGDVAYEDDYEQDETSEVDATR